MGSEEYFIMRNFLICTVHLISSGRLSQEERDGQVLEKCRIAFKILTGTPRG